MNEPHREYPGNRKESLPAASNLWYAYVNSHVFVLMHKKSLKLKNKKCRKSMARKSGKVQDLGWAQENTPKIHPEFVQHTFSILWSEKAEKYPVVAYIHFLRAENLTFQCFCLVLCMSCLYFEKTCIILYVCNKREKHRPQLENHLWGACSFILAHFVLWCVGMYWLHG